MPRRVVISGLGAVTPLGHGAGALWAGLREGRSALAPITLFDASGFRSRLAGEVRPPGATGATGADGATGPASAFTARDSVPKSYRKATKVMARDTELAVVAAKLAVEDARLVTRGTDGAAPGATSHPGERVGCHIGAGLIAAETDELTSALVTARADDGAFSLRRWGNAPEAGGQRGLENLTPLWMLKYLPNMLACHVTIIHGAEGPSNTITCGEASGLLSIGESARVIERGAADACFSGGAESKVSLMGLLRMDLTGRLAPTGDDPDGSRVVRPYDADATGTLAAEAGALAILEEESAARARGVEPYCRVAGFGAAQSAVLETGANGGGGALELAIRRALADAGASPDDVSAVVPGATGIPRVDADEADALRAVFGARLRDVPLVTVAPNMGLAAAGQGAVLAAVGALCVRHQALPARLHAGRCPEDLRAGPAPARSATLDLVLVCCSSLGGQCAALALARA